VTVCGHPVARSTHICAFFDSAAQESACVAPFFAEGLDQGEQVFAIRSAAECAPYVRRLAAAIQRSFEPEITTGQLRLRATEETYLAAPGFEADRMYDMLVHVVRESEAAGYPRLRTCGDMGWALTGLRDLSQLMEYEARVNLLTEEHECTFMCVYDLNKFGGRAIMDVLSTHPMVVMGDRVYENPYFVPPQDFLERLFSRSDASPLAQTH
jgi:hypothetical protein